MGVTTPIITTRTTATTIGPSDIAAKVTVSLEPGTVRRNYTFAFPYGYYPMIPPPYAPYSYDQYPQYMQPEQQPQVPQKTKEQIEKETRAEVTRQIDNISQAFVLGNYNRAIVRAREALKQMPDNTMLRFICSQTLFADGRFQNAAITVRSTLEKMAQTGQQDVFYPMSLYPDQSILNQQIDKLITAVNAKPTRRNLQTAFGLSTFGRRAGQMKPYVICKKLRRMP